MSAQRLLVRLALGAVLLVGGLLLIGALTEPALARRDAQRFRPPGSLVDIGGRVLHLQCEGTGTPTLLFEMGAGAWGLFWTEVHREMTPVTRACLYDRAGYGWSDPGPLPRTADALLGDLRALVERSGEAGPFILVGHSLGGWIIRLYQARYPKEVVGMALVESAHPRQWSTLPPEIWRVTRSSATALRLMGAAGHVGVLRLLADRFATQHLPEAVMPAYRATAIRPSALSTLASEIVSSEQVAAEVERVGSLGDLPVVVVSAGRSFDAFRQLAPDWPFEEAQETWMTLQRELNTLSTRSRQYVSPEATHNIHSDDPHLVVTALTQLVHTARADVRAGRMPEARAP